MLCWWNSTWHGGAPLTAVHRTPCLLGGVMDAMQDPVRILPTDPGTSLGSYGAAIVSATLGWSFKVPNGLGLFGIGTYTLIQVEYEQFGWKPYHAIGMRILVRL